MVQSLSLNNKLRVGRLTGDKNAFDSVCIHWSPLYIYEPPRSIKALKLWCWVWELWEVKKNYMANTSNLGLSLSEMCQFFFLVGIAAT